MHFTTQTVKKRKRRKVWKYDLKMMEDVLSIMWTIRHPDYVEMEIWIIGL